MASPENQHCANCIGTLSFPMANTIAYEFCWPRSVILTNRILLALPA